MALVSAHAFRMPCAVRLLLTRPAAVRGTRMQYERPADRALGGSVGGHLAPRDRPLHLRPARFGVCPGFSIPDATPR